VPTEDAAPADRVELLAAFDAQLRTAAGGRPPPGLSCSWDGPLLRCVGMHRGFVTAGDLGGLPSGDVDALIARTVAYFAARGEAFEWKTYGHDRPADLPSRLRQAGLVAEPRETVLIGETSRMAVRPVLPGGVAVREVTDWDDLARIAALQEEVWDEDQPWLAGELAELLAADPDHVTIMVAEVDGEVVSNGRLEIVPGTEFAGLWGGATLAAWRGRGIYRALVAARAVRARERGVRYLQVDASDDSRPILERLGFVAVTTTTPYVWTPPLPGQPDPPGGAERASRLSP
jgi:GNAT superfamily N-acetyltransferase